MEGCEGGFGFGWVAVEVDGGNMYDCMVLIRPLLDGYVDEDVDEQRRGGAAVPYQYQNEDLGSQAPRSSKSKFNVM